MKNMTLSDAEYLIVVMIAFTLFFVVTVFRVPFPINVVRTFVGTFNVEVTSFP